MEEAKRLNANTIDTAHILLALLKEDNGNAVKILEKLGVDPSKMPDEIIKDSVFLLLQPLPPKDSGSLLIVTRCGQILRKIMSSMCSQTLLGDCEPAL